MITSVGIHKTGDVSLIDYVMCCVQVGHSEGLPETLPDADEMDEGLQKILHHVLLEVCVCLCDTHITE